MKLFAAGAVVGAAATLAALFIAGDRMQIDARLLEHMRKVPG
jgi:hypothetical protein